MHLLPSSLIRCDYALSWAATGHGWRWQGEGRLAIGTVSLEVIAEDPMDAAFAQISQQAAVLLLASGSVHAMIRAWGCCEVCAMA